MERKIEDTEKATERAQRDTDISKNIARIGFEELKKANDLADQIYQIDDKIASQLTKGPYALRKKEREEKRKRQLEKDNERLEKKWEEVRRRKYLAEAMKQKKEELKNRRGSRDSSKDSKGSKTSKTSKGSKGSKGKKKGSVNSAKGKKSKLSLGTQGAKKASIRGSRMSKRSHKSSMKNSQLKADKSTSRLKTGKSAMGLKGDKSTTVLKSGKSAVGLMEDKSTTALKSPSTKFNKSLISMKSLHSISATRVARASAKNDTEDSAKSSQTASLKSSLGTSLESSLGLDPELNAFVEGLMNTERKTPPPPPNAPPTPWTGDQWDEWQKELQPKSPFREIEGRFPSPQYYKKALLLHEHLQQETLDLDQYFIDNFMKYEPVEEFTSDVTSNLTPFPEEEELSNQKEFIQEHPLTEQSKHRYRSQQQQEQEQEKLKKQDELLKRIIGLEEIKKRMDLDRRDYLCHKEEKEHRKQLQKEKIARLLMCNYGINTSNLPPQSENVFDKYLSLQKQRENYQYKQIQSRIDILKRLLAEERNKQKLKQQMEKELHPQTHTQRAKRRKMSPFPLHGGEAGGEEEETDYQPAVDVYEFDKISPIEIIVPPMPPRLEEEGDEKRTSQEKQVKNKKNIKKNKSAKASASKKKNDETEQAKSETVYRTSVEPKDWPIKNLEPIFSQCKKIQDEDSKYREKENICTDEKTGFYWKPAEVIFKDFEYGRTYHRKVVVTNTSTQWLSCYFKELQVDESMQLALFDIANTHPRRICAGLSFDFTITFKPQATWDEIFGKIIFVVERENQEPQYFCIPLDCNSIYARQPLPYVTPTEVNFQDVRECADPHEKIIKLVNPSALEYIASIHKVEDDSSSVQGLDIKGTQDKKTEDGKDARDDLSQSLDEKYELDGTAMNALDELTAPKPDHGIKYVIDECLGKVHRLTLDPDTDLFQEFLKIDAEEIVKNIMDEWMGKIEKITIDAAKYSTAFIDECLAYVTELARNARKAAKYIIDNCMNTIGDVFKFNPMHYIPLSPKSTATVRIIFGKTSPGYYAEEYVVRFDDLRKGNVVEVDLLTKANVIPFPVVVDPPLVSFNTCLYESETYQAPFKVRNESSYAVKLTTKVPLGMRPHAEIYPPETYVQPHSSVNFSLRLRPRCDLAETAPKYFNKDVEVLDFPGIIYARHRSLEDCPPLTVQVLAVVTSPFELDLAPLCSNLGVVSTQETVCKVLTLTNRSNAWLDYSFPGLPECVQIQPNFGLGTISPGEERRLHLLYSPTVSYIEGNEKIHRSGTEGPHTFLVKVISAAAKAGPGDICRKELEMKKFKFGEFDWDNLAQVQNMLRSDLPCDIMPPFCYRNGIDLRFPSSAEKESEDSIQEAKPKKDPKKHKEKKTSNVSTVKNKEFKFTTEWPLVHNLSEFLDLHTVIELQEDDQSDDSFEEEEKTFRDHRIYKNIIHCHAFVRDPLCELSVTKMTLPPTPCCSYTLATFYLRGSNATSAIDCTCGILPPLDHQKPFVAWFSFQSSNEQLRIEPNCGQFCSGQDVKLRVIFKPRLTMKNVETKAREIKSHQLIAEELQKKENQAHEKKQKDSKNKKNNGKKGEAKGKKDKNSKKKKKNTNPGDETDATSATATDNATTGDETDDDTKKKKKKKEEKQDTSKKSDTTENGGQADKAKNQQDMEALQKKYDPGNVKIGPDDFPPAEKHLLEFLEPYCLLVNVKCLVETSYNEGKTWRPEVHRMKIICPVVKPDLMVLPEFQTINFGAVPIGTRERRLLNAQNLRTDTIDVSISLLNPVGPFICPMPKTKVAPEHILVMPITFCPTTPKEENEYFEIYSGRTIIPIHLIGNGEEAKYTITPEFLVYRFKMKKKPPKEPDKIVIAIENKCSGTLPFTLEQKFVTHLDMKTILSVMPLTEDAVSIHNENDKDGKTDKKSSNKLSKKDSKKGSKLKNKGKKKKSNSDKKRRSTKSKKKKSKIEKGKPKDKNARVSKAGLVGEDIDLLLNPYENIIFHESTPNINEVSAAFQVTSASGEGNHLKINAKETSYFTLSFIPIFSENDKKLPVVKKKNSKRNKKKNEPLVSPAPADAPASPELKNREDVENDSESLKMNNYVFAAKYDLILGSSQVTQSFYFVAYPETFLKGKKA